MLITGTKGDCYHKSVLQKILKEGTLDINPRPHYSDGLPAYTYSINHIMQ
jgi:thymidylate synthase